MLPGRVSLLQKHVTEERMKRGSVQDYVAIMKERHRKAGRAERGRLLDEFVRVDRPSGSRLAPFMEELVCKLEMWEELLLPHDVGEALCSMSASTIDRLLRAYKECGRRPWTSATKPGSLLKAAIPIRTFGEWGHPPPGHLEVDLVAHWGGEHRGVLSEHADGGGHSYGLGGVS